MERSCILLGIKEFFKLGEFVSGDVLDKYGDRAWDFLDTNMLDAILIIRRLADKPITVNTWLTGGKFSQRCLRENTCQIVEDKTFADSIYLSAHVLGKAIDFDISGMDADAARMFIHSISSHFTFKIRLEAGVSWVHLDVIDTPKNPKIYEFLP